MITKKGTVVTLPGAQTIKVRVDEYRTHPKYKKRFLRSSNFLAHDEKAEAQVGDEVSIQQSKPISKRKHWKLTEIHKTAQAA